MEGLGYEVGERETGKGREREGCVWTRLQDQSRQRCKSVDFITSSPELNRACPQARRPSATAVVGVVVAFSQRS